MTRAFRAMALVVLSVTIMSASEGAATRYALCVGIDWYSTPGNELMSCVNDAHGVATRLAADDTRWDTDNITLLTNSQATEAAIRGWLSACPAVSGDTIFYFHSSHGGNEDMVAADLDTCTDAGSYLCTYSTSQPITDDELASDLANNVTDGVKVIIVIDACHSGGMIDSVGKGLGAKVKGWPFMENVVAKYKQKKLAKGPYSLKALDTDIGWVTAADYDEYSSATDPYSQFAGHFIYGFRLADGSSDGNGDGSATFRELADYAKTNGDDSGQTAQISEGGNTSLTSTVATANYVRNASYDETMESTSVGSLPSGWTTSGDADWAVASSASHGGSRSLVSGGITDDESTSVSVTLTTGVGEMSFWRYCSSEFGFDYMYFYIDGELAGQATGDFSGWQYVTAFVETAGSHTFKWTYAKDGSEFEGSDCVWIDDITFPGEPPVAVIAHDDPQPTGSNVTFNGTSSTDDGTITDWDWDLDNDGSYNDDTGETGVTCQWADDGTYTVGLRVTDDEGLTDTTTVSVVITNRAPTAIGTSDYTVAIEVGESITFNDNTSTDADGTVDEWVWDFDDGSTARTVSADLPFDYTHSWTSAASYDVTLTVIDDDGESSTAAAVVTVVVTAMTDSDGDLLPDAWELDNFSLLTDSDGTDDTDGDGLNDLAEFQNHTDPNETDTDGDTHSDSVEVARASNPLDAESLPSSGGGGGGGGGGCATGGNGAGWAAAMLVLFAVLVGLRMKPKAAKVRRR